MKRPTAINPLYYFTVWLTGSIFASVLFTTKLLMVIVPIHVYP